MANNEDAQHVFDISKTQIRSFIEAEEAQQLLKPLSEPGNPYTKIRFSNKSFSTKAAQVAAPILSSMKHQLEEVDLSDIVAARTTAEALDVFNLFSEALEGSNLKSLDLSDNALGEKGVRAFGKLLRSQTRLEELYLSNNGISEEAARAVCELVPQTDKLRVLQFQKNNTQNKGAEDISKLVKRSPALEDFLYSSNWVDTEGCKKLAEALKICTHLKKLDLSYNSFRSKDGIRLSKTILHFDDLTEINLSYLNLKDEGAVAIAGALEISAPSLRVLELAGNYITAIGASSVAACIAAKQHLVKLNLSDNKLRDDGAVAIAGALEISAPSFRVLGLARNYITAIGASSVAACTAAKQHLVKLNLSNNKLRDDGAVAIAGALEISAPSLRVLGLTGNYITAIGASSVAACTAAKQHLVKLNISDNKLRDDGARAIALSVVNKPDFKLLLIDKNFISDEEIDELREIFKKFPEKLGSLDDQNGPNDDDEDDDDDDDEDEGSEDELVSMLEKLDVNKEED